MFWNRRIIVQIFTKEDEPYKLKERLFIIDSKENFRIRFQVKKNITAEPNLATIQIFNLKTDTSNTFASKSIWVKLYAGFEEPTLIYCGGIASVSVNKEGADRVCTLICRTDWDLDKKVYTGSFMGFVTLNTVLFDVLQKAKIPFKKENILVEGSSDERGFCTLNSIKNVLDELANWYKFSWSLQDYGFLAISDNKILPTAHTINSPLIDSYKLPKEDDRTSGGYDITCLLNGDFQVGQNVTFTSKYNGTQSFKLYQVIHRGDSHDNSWETNLSGYVPGSLKEENQERGIFELP